MNKPKIKLLFRIGYIYHKAAFDPVIELLINNDRYDVWFSLDMEKKRFLFFDFPFRSHIISELESKHGYRFTHETNGFDIVICGDTIPDASSYGQTLLCFLNHGTGIKNGLYRNLSKKPDDTYQIFVEGTHRVDSLQNSPSLGKNAVHLVGLPKLDHYFQGKYNNKNEILSKLGLNPNKKTVLFAPTYKPTCMYTIKDDIFEQTKEFNLIIKLHPYSWMGKYAPHKQHRIFERRVKKYHHAVLLPFDEYNIVPYYSASDVLISEASSTVFDYLALGKFGIIVNLPCDKLVHSDGEPILEIDNREFLKDAFLHVESGSEIGTAIKKALQPTQSMVQSADKWRQRLFYKLDGKASLRFIQKMEELHQQGTHQNIPLNR